MEGLSACRCLTIMPVSQWRNHLELGDAVRHAHCSCIKLGRIHAVLVWILQKKCSYHERCMPEKCSHTSIWCGITVQGIRSDINQFLLLACQPSNFPGLLGFTSCHTLRMRTKYITSCVTNRFCGGGGEVTRL